MPTQPMKDILPRYDNPPIVESAVGVYFLPLMQFSAPHFGTFWGAVHDEYPNAQMHPPQKPVVEIFDGPPALEDIPLLDPPSQSDRCWYRSSDDQFVLQVQNNFFMTNWRKTTENSPYPGYDEELRERFRREWRRFQEFAKVFRLGPCVVRQCEISYVNHIDRGIGWDSFAEIGNVFPRWRNSVGSHERHSSQFLPDVESIQFRVSFRIPDFHGRLWFSVSPVIRAIGKKETIQLTVVARGRPEANDEDSVMAWLDEGRRWIVKGFTDFTSERMHEIWGRKE